MPTAGRSSIDPETAIGITAMLDFIPGQEPDTSSGPGPGHFARSPTLRRLRAKTIGLLAMGAGARPATLRANRGGKIHVALPPAPPPPPLTHSTRTNTPTRPPPACHLSA